MKRICCLILVLVLLIPAASLARPQSEIDMINSVVILTQLCFTDTEEAKFTVYYDQERDFFCMEIISEDLIYSEYQTLYKFGGKKFEKAVDLIKEAYSDGMADIMKKCGVSDVDVVIKILSTEREFCFCLVNGAFSPDDITEK